MFWTCVVVLDADSLYAASFICYTNSSFGEQGSGFIVVYQEGIVPLWLGVIDVTLHESVFKVPVLVCCRTASTAALNCDMWC